MVRWETTDCLARSAIDPMPCLVVEQCIDDSRPRTGRSRHRNVEPVHAAPNGSNSARLVRFASAGAGRQDSSQRASR